jgi:hypothetical protein
MTPILSSTILCGVLACAALLLAVYRKVIARKEDDMLHVLDSEATLVTQQHAVAIRLEAVDRWGKAITALAIVFGILAGVLLLVAAWQNSLKLAA